MINGSVPLAPLDSTPEGATGLNPRVEDDLAPLAFYLSLYGSVVTKLRVAKMSLGDVRENEKLGAVDFLASLVKTKFSLQSILIAIRPNGRA